MTKIIKRHGDELLVNANLSALHPVLARILTARGINEPREIEYGLENLLPFSTLSGIDNAVQCLTEALRAQSRILIIGDFDVDGATSSALAVSCLRAFGAAAVDFLVPNRFDFGYGLTPEIVEVALKRQPKLLITVDNGIANDDGVRFAKEHGLQVIITDHHLCPPVLPPADAIVNPNLPDDKFLSKNLAGVGVIFYVMLALRAHLRTTDWFISQNIEEPNMAQFLDLVALGTMADVVKLDQNNRILIAQGLSRIRAKKCRPGILALLNVSKREANCITANDLSFAIAPRLNAAGHLDDMSMGINCLLAADFNSAYTMAVELDKLNQERIQIEAQMQADAHSILENLHLTQNTSHSICLYNESWHQGVVGILASRIKEKYEKPVIVFAQTNANEIKGSARSIESVHIRDAIANVASQCPNLIAKFGGHAMAAGLTLRKENFAEFSQLFNEAVQKNYQADLPTGQILSDGELLPADLTLAFAELLNQHGPWGAGFSEPIFDGEFDVVSQHLLQGRHLKIMLKSINSDRIIEGLQFKTNVNIWPNQRVRRVHIAYRLDINEYRGLRSLTLKIEQITGVENGSS